MAYSNNKTQIVDIDKREEEARARIRTNVESEGKALDAMRTERTQIEAENQAMIGTSKTISEVNSELAKAQDLLQSIENQIKNRQQVLNEHARLIQKNKVLDAENDKLELEIENSTETLHKLRMSYEQIEKNKEKTLSVISGLESKAKEIEKKIERLEAQSSSLEIQIIEQQTTFNTVKNDIVSLTSTKGSLEGELNIVKSRIATELAKLETKEAELDQKKSELEQFEVASKARIDSEYQAKNKDLQDREGVLSEQRSWLEADREYLREAKLELEATYKIKIKRII